MRKQYDFTDSVRNPYAKHCMGIAIRLADSCVYTIATPQHLLDASKNQWPRPELKRWVGAAELLKKARHAGRELSILFSDSGDCSKLIAWSVLLSVIVTTKGTYYTIGQLCHPERHVRVKIANIISIANKHAGF